MHVRMPSARGLALLLCLAIGPGCNRTLERAIEPPGVTPAVGATKAGPPEGGGKAATPPAVRPEEANPAEESPAAVEPREGATAEVGPKPGEGATPKVPSKTGEAGKEAPEKPESLAPFVPTPMATVEAMLRLAEVKPTDTVYDLGCGDGRILIMAAQKFGARGVGVELDPKLYTHCLARVRELDLTERIRIIHGDLMQVDVSPATVVTLYLMPAANAKLKPRLEAMLRPGARVVSHDFAVHGWKLAASQKIEDDRGWERTIYLYRR